ncbi:ankyrin repeat domain-containing protein SOWAHA [Misgurnus anguillicaudatus]|uniref:ankyrin repeat domain-containing protein SOWAHA n=1 Tax=Misgurnus anguillicaudatus TaxID=75329 RepID=UPI003CCFCEBF
MALTQENILTFLLERGGKVKNSELVNKFKVVIAVKKENRDLFKRLINSVAVVKQLDDVKYVVVKKKYQGFVKGETISLSNSLVDIKSQCCRSDKIQNADIINNNYHFPTQTASQCSSDSVHPVAPSDFNLAKVLNVSNVRSGQTESVFALVAIKTPPKPELHCDERGKTHHKAPGDAKETSPQCIAERSTKLKETFHLKDGFLYRSTRTKRKELEAHGSPQLRRSSKITRSGNDVKDTYVIPLGPVEHEWLVKSAKGCWTRICSLLLQHPQLAEKQNFMSGFTVLHWAAKSGNCEMVCKVMDVTRQSAGGICVNAKSYDGYTPLHIAAIHSHEGVLSLLVCKYGANTNIRDNSGKKPYHYLSQDVSFEIRKMLGDPRFLHPNGHCQLGDDQNRQEFSKGFKPLGKLFQPHVVGHLKKRRRRPSFRFISDDH